MEDPLKPPPELVWADALELAVLAVQQLRGGNGPAVDGDISDELAVALAAALGSLVIDRVDADLLERVAAYAVLECSPQC